MNTYLCIYKLFAEKRFLFYKYIYMWEVHWKFYIQKTDWTLISEGDLDIARDVIKNQNPKTMGWLVMYLKLVLRSCFIWENRVFSPNSQTTKWLTEVTVDGNEVKITDQWI